MILIEELFKALCVDIKPREAEEEILRTKLEKAYKEVELRRGYPIDLSEEAKQSDMSRYYSKIYDIALYDFNQRGAEGQGVIQENGEYRSWIDRDKLFHGIIAYASVV